MSLSDYRTQGFALLKNVLCSDELDKLRFICEAFHSCWLKDNDTFYRTRAINSSGLTGQGYLSDKQRLMLYQFIVSHPVLTEAREQLLHNGKFMGSQLFFNPFNPDQTNYWHRDPQYHLSIPEQEAALKGPDVIHIRIPLADEPGIEVMPGTHKRWDTPLELAVRTENDSKKSCDPLPGSTHIPLHAGDVLIFSANMIHRGLYGMDRFALDILFCDDDPVLTSFISAPSRPEPSLLKALGNPDCLLPA